MIKKGEIKGEQAEKINAVLDLKPNKRESQKKTPEQILRYARPKRVACKAPDKPSAIADTKK